MFARDETIQCMAHGQRVGVVGLDPFVLLIQLRGRMTWLVTPSAVSCRCRPYPRGIGSDRADLDLFEGWWWMDGIRQK